MHVIQCLSRSGVGGGQEIVWTLTRALKETNPTLSLTAALPAGRPYPDRLRSLGIHVEELPFDHLSVGGFVRGVTTLRRLHPDVVHTHGKGAGAYVRLFPRLLGHTRIIHSYHGFHPPNGRLTGLLYTRLERILLRHTDVIVAVSGSEAKEIQFALRAAESKIIVIPNCVDRDLVLARAKAPLEPKTAEFLGSERSKTIITMIARNDPAKNYPLACDAAREVFARNTNVMFIFIGAGSQQPETRKLVRDFPDRVLNIPGMDNPYPVLAAGSALMMTSRKEASPVVLLEAFCLGKPVIGTSVPGISDQVRHGWNGFLSSEDPEALADAIDRLSRDQELRRTLSDNARKVGELLDVAAWARRYRTIYEGEGT